MRLITFAELKSLKGIGYSRVHIARLMKLGQFPQHVSIGEAANGHKAWLEEEIDSWIKARVAQRGRPQAAA